MSSRDVRADLTKLVGARVSFPVDSFRATKAVTGRVLGWYFGGSGPAGSAPALCVRSEDGCFFTVLVDKVFQMHDP